MVFEVGISGSTHRWVFSYSLQDIYHRSWRTTHVVTRFCAGLIRGARWKIFSCRRVALLGRVVYGEKTAQACGPYRLDFHSLGGALIRLTTIAELVVQGAT